MPTPDHIVLMGMMGAGKTTVGRALATRLHVSYADNDEHLRSARPETLAARVSRDPVRPLIGHDPATSMAALVAERAPGFARLAGVVIDVDDLDVASVVERIVASLAGLG
jgi:shikimate kinase